jgi:hypothetical protein
MSQQVALWLFQWRLHGNTFHGIGAEDANVVSPLEGGRVGHGALAHAALHLTDGLVLVFLHPGEQVFVQGGEVADAVPK